MFLLELAVPRSWLALYVSFAGKEIDMLLVEFIAGSHLLREPAFEPKLPILRNGPPGTFVVFPSLKLKVSLPTDQIVFADDSGGTARVGFGGMSYAGVEDGKLMFRRIRDLAPEDTLAPERGVKMLLEPSMVARVSNGALQAWPLG